MTPQTLLFAMLVATMSQQAAVPRSTQKPRVATQVPRGPDTDPVVVQLLNSGRTHEEAKRDADSRAHEAALTESLVYWTKVLGIATIILAAGTILLYADAREKGRRELRAYLGFSYRWIGGKRNKDGRLETEELETRTESETRESYKTAIFLSNYGKSPAEVYFKGACGVLKHPAPRGIVAKALDTATGTRYDGVPKLCNPGTELPLYYELRSSGPSRPPNSDERVYAYGTALYKDIFGHWHFNNICTYYNPESTTGSTWVTASTFNDAGAISKRAKDRRWSELWPQGPAAAVE